MRKLIGIIAGGLFLISFLCANEEDKMNFASANYPLESAMNQIDNLKPGDLEILSKYINMRQLHFKHILFAPNDDDFELSGVEESAWKTGARDYLLYRKVDDFKTLMEKRLKNYLELLKSDKSGDASSEVRASLNNNDKTVEKNIREQYEVGYREGWLQMSQ